MAEGPSKAASRGCSNACLNDDGMKHGCLNNPMITNSEKNFHCRLCDWPRYFQSRWKAEAKQKEEELRRRLEEAAVQATHSVTIGFLDQSKQRKVSSFAYVFAYFVEGGDTAA